MLNWIALTGFAVSIVGLGFYLYRHYHPKHQYHAKYNIAVHEAGHTLLAWACTLVCEITCVDTLQHKDGGRGGTTIFKIYAKTVRGMWSELVITLAGIAAEVNIYGKFQAQEVSEDLISAWELSRKLVNQQQLLAPWKLPKTPTIPFSKIYRKVSPDQILILEQAYAMAGHLLITHKQRYHQLMSSLINYQILDNQKVSEVLGKRQWTKTLSSEVLFI